MLDESSQESLAEYTARPPIFLKKIHYEPFKGRVLSHTTYSDYFKENLHMFEALDFLADLTQHIPPKGLQLIRRYGLYASRTKGRWEQMAWVAKRARDGWKAAHRRVGAAEDRGYEPLSDGDEEVDIDANKRAWARLLAKVYELDPFVCPKCGGDMKVIAIIEDPDELKEDSPASGQDRAVPTGIRSRSPQLTHSPDRPFGRRVSVSQRKRLRSSLDLSYPCVNAFT